MHHLPNLSTLRRHISLYNLHLSLHDSPNLHRDRYCVRALLMRVFSPLSFDAVFIGQNLVLFVDVTLEVIGYRSSIRLP